MRAAVLALTLALAWVSGHAQEPPGKPSTGLPPAEDGGARTGHAQEPPGKPSTGLPPAEDGGARTARAQEPPGKPSTGLVLDAEKARYDGEAGRLVFTNVYIAEGDNEIRADRAESNSVDFKNTPWYFSGNVQFRAFSASMSCDTAELKFTDGRLERAIIRGDPVAMRNEGKRVVQGRAASVEYEAEAALIRFLGGAVLETSESRVSGESITFDLRAETVTVSPGEGEPVQFIFDFFSSPSP